ncbi:DUF4241 domain-containing protein [Gymnodinialimonas hymeniacidonis]|uniref:DUF4241 domain-containing protein n=1 Tax=Gymnodinialimonas hymeniacidonis TaxID=3126508 RepID=UPI0034C697C8
MTARLPFLRPLAVLAAVCGPAQAQDATNWLRQGIGMPTDLHVSDMWRPRGGEIYATDPLTLWQTEGATLSVPDAPARLIGLLERDQGRAALMALIWSNADVVCGEDLSTIGVDTGLAGFVTPANVRALDAYAASEGDLYAGTYAEQLDDPIPTIPFIARLPSGATFPVSGSGWGDGGYPVASLYDAQGNMVALYAHFIPSGDEWLLPPPCDAPTG